VATIVESQHGSGGGNGGSEVQSSAFDRARVRRLEVER
jgi:hypothetical protein